MNMQRKRGSAALLLSLAAHILIGLFLAFTFIIERVKNG